MVPVQTSAVARMFSRISASSREKNCVPTELGIVLIGGRRGDGPSGKSSVGNIILGRDVFETNRRTSKSVMRQEEVSGRQVTVVDTPGWRSHCPLDLTPKRTQLEIQQSVHLCPPGPHAFVLVMPLDTPYLGTGMSVEEHVSSLLSDRVWRHTIVVFTVTDKNKMSPDLIRSDSELRYLTKKCEDRFHVLNITDREDGSQVTELWGKIEQMVTSNGCHYETKKQVSEELKEKGKTIRSRAEQRKADTQKQTMFSQTELTGGLRIQLLGSLGSGKSSVGNAILGGRIFNAGQRSVQCDVKHGKVAEQHLTVVDAPGWTNSPLQDTSEMDKLEIQISVCLCPPGPHAVLLMVPVDEAFTKAQKVAIEEHMALLSQRVWSHTIVVFTYGDWLGDTSIEQHIEAEGEDLRWLVDKCGNRYHVFNNKKRDVTQVTELVEKIEEMVAGHRGGHYENENDGVVSEGLSERKRNIEEHAHTLMTKTHRQTAALKAMFEGEHQSLPDVNVMVVGGEEFDRSRAGNNILQRIVFRETLHKEYNIQTKLTECDRQQRHVAERNVTVVNCPDWSTTPPSQKIKDVLLHGLTLCSPGPHAVLLTVSVRSSFSEADKRSVEENMELLGDGVWRHTVVLFTWGRWLEERCVEEYIESEGEPLRWLLEKCGYRYHVLQFIKWDLSEVTELMEKIENMVTRNRGHFEPLDSIEDKSDRGTRHSKMPSFKNMKILIMKNKELSQFEKLQILKAAEDGSLFDELKKKEILTADEWTILKEECSCQKEEWKKRAEEWKKREEEWKKREEEMIEKVLKFVAKEPEVLTQPAGRRRNSMDRLPPSMSGGTPSETGGLYSRSASKVSDWLKRCRGPIATSSGYDTMSDAPSQPSQVDTDVMSVIDEDAS